MSGVETEPGCLEVCPFRAAVDTAREILDENLGQRFDAETISRKTGELMLVTDVLNKVHSECEGPEGDGAYCAKRVFVQDVMGLIMNQTTTEVKVPSIDGREG